ncbi:MAG TPA: glycosyltransferase family A protein [Solirubrobacteraceae bacterium]|nr:glycosyltransferase family A protein [Solirubrobacteraceae bacterium]
MVIPTRDRPRELERALSVVRGQRDIELETVIVDDGSRVPVKLPGGEDSTTRVIRLERSLGVAAARNRGVAAARGEWIAFLDDDDIWSPERLRLLWETANASPAEIVTSGTAKLDDRGRILSVRSLPEPANIRRALRSINVLGGPSAVMLRRQLIDRVGGFDESLSVLADWELWLRVTDQASLAVCPEVLTGYVVHRGGMHVTRTDEAMAEFAELGRRYGTARRPGDWGMSDDVFTRWAASAYRAGGHPVHAASLFWRNWRRYRYRPDLLQALASLFAPAARLLDASARAQMAAPDWVGLYQDRPGAELRPMREAAAHRASGT